MADVPQIAVDGILAALLALAGGVIKALRGDQVALRNDHDELREYIDQQVQGISGRVNSTLGDMPNVYARRDDVKDGFARMEAQHKALTDRMDAQNKDVMAKLDRLIERL